MHFAHVTPRLASRTHSCPRLETSVDKCPTSPEDECPIVLQRTSAVLLLGPSVTHSMPKVMETDVPALNYPESLVIARGKSWSPIIPALKSTSIHFVEDGSRSIAAALFATRIFSGMRGSQDTAGNYVARNHRFTIRAESPPELLVEYKRWEPCLHPMSRLT